MKNHHNVNHIILDVFLAVVCAIIVTVIEILIRQGIVEESSRITAYASMLAFVSIYAICVLKPPKKYYALAGLFLIILIGALVPRVLYPPPVPIGEISIPGYDEQGTKFTAKQDGEYIFTYSEGVYSPYPDADPNLPEWRTRVSVYKNHNIVWARRPYKFEDDPSIIYMEPSEADATFGNYNRAARTDSVEVAKIESDFRFNLRAGDYLIFIVSDDQGWYNTPGPNVGEMVFKVSFK